ncbi:amidase [Thioclava sp. GXIMD2076]|uniref:Amidase n=1 Tax=Thioclava kandeliae TaxID=3070818 RepID=A0ABV1SJ98_9RHOB
MTDIADLSAVAQARAIAAREISPVEAVQAAFDRIEARAELNAFVTLCPERALAEARAAEARIAKGAARPLEGVPFSVKDLIATEGVRTTQGSKIFSQNVPKEDGVSVARARGAGGILIGKTTTPEFGHKPEATSPLSGRTLHPTHPDRTPGASSSGSAVAVAAGMGPLSIGSDGGGSIRIPAACCGIVGLKPTLGMIPHLSLPDLFGANSYVGPMARDVEDTALFFETMAGFDPRDPWGQGALPVVKPFAGFKGLRVGWLPNGGAQVEPETAAATRAAIDAMAREGAEIEEIEIDLRAVEPAFLTVLRSGLSARMGAHVARHGNDMDPSLLVRIIEGRDLSAFDMSQASFERTRTFNALQEVLARCDVIVSPVLTAPAIPITVDSSGDVEIAGNRGPIRGAWYPFTYPLNLTGHPAISMPCGRTASGLPIGLQIMGPWYQDRFLLQLAAQVETLLAVSRV